MVQSRAIFRMSASISTDRRNNDCFLGMVRMPGGIFAVGSEHYCPEEAPVRHCGSMASGLKRHQ
jgi:hypothetical protein